MAATLSAPIAQPSLTSTVAMSSSTFIIKETPTSKFHQTLSTSTTSSSISSLFERVTNFRRSLIKSNHQKKNKSRPSSGSFNLFHKNSLSIETTGAKCSNETNSVNINENYNITKTPSSTWIQMSTTENVDDDVSEEGAPTLNNLSLKSSMIYKHQPKMLIHVDEEDAIYGFTSMNLNNPTRRQLKQVSSIVTTTTSTLTSTNSSLSSSSSSASSSSSIAKSKKIQKNEQIFVSSSCISLYETIDECENDNSTPEGINENKSSLQSNSDQSADWKRNRRSAILLGSNQQEFEIAFKDAQLSSPLPEFSISHYHQQSPSSSSYVHKQYQRKTSNPLNIPSQLNHQYHRSCSSLQTRSSDDILMMSSTTTTFSSSSNQRKYSDGGNCSNRETTSSRIYENLNIIRNKSNHQRVNYFSDKRKLTKDSGYESSSTLVSLNTGTSTTISATATMATNHSLTITSSDYGMLNIANTTNLLDHARSDSIDSNLSHKSFDSPTSNNSSTSIMMTATNSVPTTPESQNEDSPPPTPPIRYSSLPEHYRRKCSSKSWKILEDRPQYEITEPLSMNFFHLKDSWPYSLYPKMRRKQDQNVIIDENPYDDDPTPLPLPLLNSNDGYSIPFYTMVPNTQVVRSHRIQPLTRQETTINMANIKPEQQSILSVLSSPQMLPPKNNCRKHQDNIKEIQKRAVYEFYLRQKEKKNKTQEIINSPINVNLSPPKEPSEKEIYSNFQNTQTKAMNENESFSLPSPPSTTSKSLSFDFDCYNLNLSTSIEEIPKDSSPESDFPPPPLFLPSIGYNSNMNQQSLIDILDQRYIDLMNFWPSVDFSQLIPMLLVVFNMNEAEDEDEPLKIESNQEEENIEQELIRIDQTRKMKHKMLSRRKLLQMEQTRIKSDLMDTEKVGQFVRNKLGQLDQIQKNKLDLLCIDMVRIIGLIFSIHHQLNECHPRLNEEMKAEKSKNEDQKNEHEEKRARLTKQLDEARQLRDGIEQRCFIFIERIKRRFGQLSFKQLSALISHQNDDHQDGNHILVAILNLDKKTNKNNVNPEDMNLSAMSRWYLGRLEMLTIQQYLIDFLINQEIYDE